MLLTETILQWQPLFAFTDGDVWRPGIGDPTFMGWFTVFCYLAAAVLCGKIAMTTRAKYQRWIASEPLFWAFLCVFLFLLGINKQLDLQTWFTLSARRAAIDGGWYENRRLLQALFVFVIACFGAAGLFVLFKLNKTNAGRNRLALAGMLFLTAFVLIRAASFHHIDAMLKADFAGIRMNWVLEIGGILLIALGAFKRWRREKSGIVEGPGFVWVSAGQPFSITRKN